MSLHDDFVRARIASCLGLVVAAGAERMDRLDQPGADPFLASRLRGGLEALLASTSVSAADRGISADRARRVGWDNLDGSPFQQLAGEIGATPAAGSDRDGVAWSTLLACIRERGGTPAAPSPDRMDYRLGAALDYLGGARMLDPTQAAEAAAVLRQRGVTVSDPTFAGLYAALNAELDDVIRRIRPMNYTWRGRLFGRLTRDVIKQVAGNGEKPEGDATGAGKSSGPPQ